jgi:glycosyltransferase involved in cell wall biosynthesis
VDIVHARSRAPGWSAYRAARKCGVPFVTTYHGTYAAQHKLKEIYNSVMARGDRVIANSTFIAGLIHETYGNPLDEIAVVPRGVDPDDFSPERVTLDRKHGVLRAWGLESRRGRIVLLPARLTRWKGQLVFIEAFARLRREGRHDLMAVLIGDAKDAGAFAGEIRDRIKAEKLTDDVIMAGYCEDMPAAYAVSDVVVSPATQPEAFGRVAVEAQAMGKPVIVADHGGARETVIDGETGWRVAPGDEAALARAIAAALDLTARQRETLAERARRHVIEAYSVRQMCDRTMALYEELASRGARAE